MTVRQCPDFAYPKFDPHNEGRETHPAPGSAVRCPRKCGGQLYLEAELGGHVFSLRCLLCSRSAGTISAIDLVEKYGLTWRDIKRATWHVVPFLWHRKPSESNDAP